MAEYKPYVDYMLNGGVCQTVYMLSRAGDILGTNLPIKQFPRYNFDLEDQNDPNVKHNIIVDQKVNLIQALANKGVAKHKQGIRLYNQKYYTVNKQQELKTYYLKKEKGGACVVETKLYILIGTWSSNQKMQNGVPQNAGECNKRVQELARTLISQGY